MKEMCKRTALFLYDDVDNVFTESWRMAVKGNIFEALSGVFDINTNSGAASNFYREAWANELIGVVNKCSVFDFVTAVDKLNRYIMNNNINQRKAEYIFRNLERIYRQSFAASDDVDKALLYDFYWSGVAVYNHLGRSDAARECRDKTREYICRATIDKEYSYRSREVVSRNDSFTFEEALKVLLDANKYQSYTDIVVALLRHMPLWETPRLRRCLRKHLSFSLRSRLTTILLNHFCFTII